ncbi:helix-turn-helix domain-containing protein [Rubrivirga litoralis]|uniref:Helix-turn-helix domain-containing protein n=1 Tax=Rubrivirga litoralis TaxID=3075598 RepID=A0ABU3BQ56_9BACT|nr:helix-turn-helix domain-containing protein [Rubrivirga sp. F394]MDT0631426.1 helix-turn-helix domain-containing protein [Rubrivirga sp. F394]
MCIDDPGPLLRYHRERASLSRRALSALSGVSETAIYDAEHGKPTVRLDTLLALLKALNLSLHVEGPLVAEYERTLAPSDDAHA